MLGCRAVLVFFVYSQHLREPIIEDTQNDENGTEHSGNLGDFLTEEMGREYEDASDDDKPFGLLGRWKEFLHHKEFLKSHLWMTPGA